MRVASAIASLLSNALALWDDLEYSASATPDGEPWVPISSLRGQEYYQ